MTTAAIHPNVIAGETPTLSPCAPASLSNLDKQHELGAVSDAGLRHLTPNPLLIRCGEGDIALLFEIPRSEVHLFDAGAGASSSPRTSLLVWPQRVS